MKEQNTIEPLSEAVKETTKNEMKHSPLPWHVSTNGHPPESGLEPAFPCVCDSSGLIHGENIVAECLGTSERCKANAKFIVAACNPYYDMLVALAAVNHWRNTGMVPRLFPDQIVSQAIAKAEGKNFPRGN